MANNNNDQVLEGIESSKKDYKQLREENLELIENHQKEVFKYLNQYYTNIVNNNSLLQNSDLNVNQKSDYNENTRHIYRTKLKEINEYLEKGNNKIIDDILKENNKDIKLMLNETETENENKLKELNKKIKQLKIDRQKFEQSINSLQKELTDNKDINEHKNQKKNIYMYTNIGIAGIVAIYLIYLIYILIIRQFFIKEGQFIYPKFNKTTPTINTSVNNTSKLNNKTTRSINTSENNKSKLNNNTTRSINTSANNKSKLNT